jgi:hypothetical protein
MSDQFVKAAQALVAGARRAASHLAVLLPRPSTGPPQATTASRWDSSAQLRPQHRAHPPLHPHHHHPPTPPTTTPPTTPCRQEDRSAGHHAVAVRGLHVHLCVPVDARHQPLCQPHPSRHDLRVLHDRVHGGLLASCAGAVAAALGLGLGWASGQLELGLGLVWEGRGLLSCVSGAFRSSCRAQPAGAPTPPQCPCPLAAAQVGSAAAGLLMSRTQLRIESYMQTVFGVAAAALFVPFWCHLKPGETPACLCAPARPPARPLRPAPARRPPARATRPPSPSPSPRPPPRPPARRGGQAAGRRAGAAGAGADGRLLRVRGLCRHLLAVHDEDARLLCARGDALHHHQLLPHPPQPLRVHCALQRGWRRLAALAAEGWGWRGGRPECWVLRRTAQDGAAVPAAAQAAPAPPAARDPAPNAQRPPRRSPPSPWPLCLACASPSSSSP